MRNLRAHLAPLVMGGLTVIACSSDPAVSGPTLDAGADAAATGDPAVPDASAPDSATSDPVTFEPPPGPPLAKASKVDILLAVDDSASMADKQARLALSLRSFLGKVTAVTQDVHLGVISSSLGNIGGDVCPDRPEANRRALLQTTGAAPNGVLSVAQSGGAIEFATNAEALVRGVGQAGCGLEAQLETMYRFLVQPDPWSEVRLDAFQQADLGASVDIEVLAQRRLFLRPDSLVLVLLLTDEDDSSADPLAIGGFGYSFASRSFPGSSVRRGTSAQGTTAPRGTSACDTNPASPDCTSCGFATTCDPNTVSCQKVRQDPNCTQSPVAGNSGAGFDGFYGPADDDLNVRFHRMKERYGVDPQYPILRYVAGFSASKVPDRATEHAVRTSAAGNRLIAEYTHRAKCTNPLFASSLPSGAGDEICALARGPRTPDSVLFGVLGGVPSQLADVAAPSWDAVVGRSPQTFDFTGINPHMVQSIAPRPDLLQGGDPNSPRGNNGTDPASGREWNTQKRDLQYACTFALAAPRSCQANTESCDCVDDPNGVPPNPPLCATDGSATQTRGKAYPSARPLRLARELGTRATIGSICGGDSAGGYASFFDRLAPTVLTRLSN